MHTNMAVTRKGLIYGLAMLELALIVALVVVSFNG